MFRYIWLSGWQGKRRLVLTDRNAVALKESAYPRRRGDMPAAVVAKKEKVNHKAPAFGIGYLHNDVENAI